jgi:hypothetical protein
MLFCLCCGIELHALLKDAIEVLCTLAPLHTEGKEGNVSEICCVWLLLFSDSVGFCFSAAFSASAVFRVGLCCWAGSLRVPFGFLLAFLPLPPFPLSRLFVTRPEIHYMRRGR